MSFSGHSWWLLFLSVSKSRFYVFRESGFTPSQVRRSSLCLSSGGSLADLPGYPYPAYYGSLSILRPCTVATPTSPLPPRRTVNADKRYPRPRSPSHFCSSRNSVIQLVILCILSNTTRVFKCKDTKYFLNRRKKLKSFSVLRFPLSAFRLFVLLLAGERNL